MISFELHKLHSITSFVIIIMNSHWVKILEEHLCTFWIHMWRVTNMSARSVMVMLCDYKPYFSAPS
jgi:hypothetical protein